MHSYCYWRFRGLSVGNETIRYPAKTAGLIEMSFGMWGGVGDSHHVLDGGTDPPPTQRGNFGVWKSVNSIAGISYYLNKC